MICKRRIRCSILLRVKLSLNLILTLIVFSGAPFFKRTTLRSGGRGLTRVRVRVRVRVVDEVLLDPRVQSWYPLNSIFSNDCFFL